MFISFSGSRDGQYIWVQSQGSLGTTGLCNKKMNAINGTFATPLHPCSQLTDRIDPGKSI